MNEDGRETLNALRWRTRGYIKSIPGKGMPGTSSMKEINRRHR
ncbi:MAG TPA: hypothetical protein VMW40_00995 [Candidatus Bathyarchaeia archaeon]|nr:hypothetical protein [Candidatus Bathyarchaeia archaeon]